MKNYDAFGKILEDLSNLYQIPGKRLQPVFTWKTFKIHTLAFVYLQKY